MQSSATSSPGLGAAASASATSATSASPSPSPSPSPLPTTTATTTLHPKLNPNHATSATAAATSPLSIPPTSSSKPAAAAAAAAASGPPGFEFPREYHFPPFFTRQPNATTRHSQLEKWSALVLSYARHHRLFRLSLSATTGSANGAGTGTGTGTAAQQHEELFHNRRLGRRLGPADAREVLEFMRREGRAEHAMAAPSKGGVGAGLSSLIGGGGGGDEDGGGDDSGAAAPPPPGDGAADVYWIYWKTPEEWARDLEAWVDDTAQKGVVFTLYELTYGEDTRGAEFHGLDPELLQKALQVLVKRGKAQIFGQEDQQGVKFF